MKVKDRWLGGLVIGFVVLVVCLVMVNGVNAQTGPGDSPIVTPTPVVTPEPVNAGDIPELPALLNVLAGPQGWVILGVLVSMLLVKWSWYNALKSDDLKQGIFVGLVAGLSIIAYALVTYVPATFWTSTAAFWSILAGVVMTWLGGNGWYMLGVKPNKRAWLWVADEEDEDTAEA